MLDLDVVDTLLLVLTVATATLTFVSERTNILQGAVHLPLFCALVVLTFER